jgi:hypothetical protein
MAALPLVSAIVPDCEDQKAVIHGRTSQQTVPEVTIASEARNPNR